MHLILVRDSLSEEQQRLFEREFPQFKIVEAQPDALPDLKPEELSASNIFYGGKLLPSELERLKELRWIHVPGPYIDDICLDLVKKQGNILISTTKEDNLPQIGEFALSVILAFGKKLFQWKEISRDPQQSTEAFCAQSMWRLPGRLALIVGLGRTGSEIAWRLKLNGLRVWGVQDPPTFHPDCEKVMPFADLTKVLPEADVVICALPREKQEAPLFRRAELELMKRDSLLLVFARGSVVDLDDLYEVAKGGKWRGVVIDAHFSKPVSAQSPLRQLPNVMITPEAGLYPLTFDSEGFHTFLYNLRQYLHNNFSDMKNLVEGPPGFESINRT